MGYSILVLWLTDSFTWCIGMGLIHALTKFIAEYNGRDENEHLGGDVIFVLKIEVVFFHWPPWAYLSG